MTDKVDWFLQSGKYLHLIYIPCRHLRSYFIKSHLVCLLEDKPSFIAFGGGGGRMILGGGIKRFSGGMEGDQSSPVVYKGGTKKTGLLCGGGGVGGL